VSEAGDPRRDDGRIPAASALERFYPPEKRIVIPERLTVLRADAGDALDLLTAE